jgi:hypothetical protein
LFSTAVLFNDVFVRLFLLRDLVWGQESLLAILGYSDTGIVAYYLKILLRGVAVCFSLRLAGSRSIKCA